MMREEMLTTIECKKPDSGQGMERYFFRASAADFKKIPGSPIAYWTTDNFRELFEKSDRISDKYLPRAGTTTTHNDRFLRLWFEINSEKMNVRALSLDDAYNSKMKWFPYNKGGGFRKYYGNNEYLLNWFNNGEELKDWIVNHPVDPSPWSRYIRSIDYYFKAGITWGDVSSAFPSFRFQEAGAVSGSRGPTIFTELSEVLLAYLNSNLVRYILQLLNPTLTFNVGNIASLPLLNNVEGNFKIERNVNWLVAHSKLDWNFYETSWDFTSLALIQVARGQWEVGSEENTLSTSHSPLSTRLSEAYAKLRQRWREMTLEMQRLEEENNRIFIEAYGLQDELTPEVPLEEITLTCNPYYRYGKKAVISSVESGGCEVESKESFSLPTSHFPLDEEMESRLLQDTMKELVSYAVGCMFGRYSLDMPGLVLANQGEGIADFVRKVESWKCVVDSEGENNGNGSQLSRVDRLAEGDEFGGVDLSSDQTLSQGGTVRSDESDPQSGSVDSLKHSGGAGEAINSGVQKLSVNSTGFQSGSGNPTDDRSTPGLPPAGASGANPESIRGNQTHDLRPDSETDLTSHSPLPTSHLSFVPDEDNVIPMLDGDWFTDDIAERFKQFLKVAFGVEHYEENLRFVEEALGKDIRKYFLKDFYTDHVKRYKKRPIYWLFSSPKGSFNALIYMHRYRPDTVSVVLNDYLREFRTKLTSHKNHLEAVSISASSSQGEKTKALKEIEKITKMIAELEEYEREVLYPLATEQVAIDLDDGVKVNYPKLGAALKKIPGLESKEE